MRQLPVTTTSPLAAALQKFKQETRLTHEEMAKELGISEVTLRRIMGHGRQPTVQVLKNLARYFRWTAWEVGVIAMYEGPIRHRGDKDRDATRAAQAVREDGD